MIALDTNILVRLLVKDDDAQTRKAAALIKRIDAEGERARVSMVAVCELVWVLRSCYGFGREAIARTLSALLASRQLAFESPDRLLRALHAFEAGKGDFADYVIREDARAVGCDDVATFDRGLLKEEGFVSP
jgi:predicted nucleic-acid-binding protein